VFVAAVAEGWRLQDRGPDRKELVLGNEAWPFPIGRDGENETVTYPAVTSATSSPP
jgi:hypothetical protein